MGLFEIISLLVLVFVIWLFWQTRVMAESAKQGINDYCHKHQLQVLAVARIKMQPSRNSNGSFCWKGTYQFEFSSDGESYYLGQATVNGVDIIDINTPAYRQSSI